MKTLSGVTSGQEPLAVDSESSATTIYVRSNITERDVEDTNGDTRTEYVYDEIQYTPAEYAIELALQAQADADYAVMMTEV